MNIGIFGGAFNPVHNGHLHLVQTMIEETDIDKLILMPTANPPHKANVEFVSDKDRFNMLSIAVSTLPCADKIEISDLEFKLDGKSYTYNTLCELKRLYPNDELYLFMGSDQLFSFDRWYRYQDILKLALVVAISRSDNDDIVAFIEQNRDMFDNRARVIVANPVEASSSQVRQLVKVGDDISSLVPSAVNEYIKEHKLYV